MHRVVITGAGAVTPFGYGVDCMMRGFADGTSCVRRMDDWGRIGGLRSQVGAPVELLNEKAIPRQKRRSMSRLSIFAVQAAEEAVAAAGLNKELLSSGRVGCIVGSTMGSATSMNEFFESYIPTHDISNTPSMLFFRSMSHAAAMNIAQYFGITGQVMATSAACASGLQAIGTGYIMLRQGLQDVVICGGSEELHPTVTGTFDQLMATSSKYNDTPTKTPRPFDAARDGLVCGEGCGVLVLETYEHAIARGVKPIAEVAGYNTCGSGDHVSQSNPAAMVRCMTAALKDAGMEPSQLGFVSAHATATIQGDKAEAEAIGDVFGNKIPVSSLKGYIGHTLGASGAIELIAAVNMMCSGTIFPCMNLEHVSPDCAGINHVREALQGEFCSVMKNCFAFGGVNSSVICKKT